MARSQPIDERDWSWSTKSAAAEDRVRQWASVLTREIAEMAVSSNVDESFSASWNRFGLGPLELNFLRCSQQSVSRSPEMIARESAPYFELLFARRSEEHTSELQSLMRISYAVFCLKKKKTKTDTNTTYYSTKERYDITHQRSQSN